jgi:ankyrin repeat protein
MGAREPSDDEVIAYAHRMLDLARAGDLALLEVVDAGLPVNLTSPTGDTLVMLAAYHGHADLVRGLLERVADPDRANDRGQTPVAAAVFRQDAKIVEVLVAAGADVHAGEPSALATARFFELPDLEALLLAGRPGG